MRIQRLGTSLLLAAALAIPATPLFAQGRGWGDQERYRGQDKDRGDHGRGRQKDRRDNRDHHDRDRRYFRDRDRDDIVAYYRDRRQLPPGLARRGELPPGIERQLVRGRDLPPGLRKRVVWFPRDLDRRLGPLPYGYRRCWVGNNVVIVNPRNFAVVDIMLNFQFDFH